MPQPRRGRPPTPLDPDASSLARLGAEIRARRHRRGLTQRQLAALVGCTHQHVSIVERGRTVASASFVAACDRALEADGALTALLPAVVRERATERHDRSAARQRAGGREAPAYAEAEALARALGLGRYAGDSQRSGEDVDPLNRRSLVGTGVGAALAGGAVPALASARDLDPQLGAHWLRLLRLLERHAAMFGPREVLAAVRDQLAVIAAQRRVARGTLRTELLRAEGRWAEFASWLCSDTGDLRGRDALAVRALRLAKEAGDADMVAWVLMWQSVWACERSDPRRAIAYARAARRTPGISDRIHGFVAEQQAYAHALSGAEAACRRSLADARDLLGRDSAPPCVEQVAERRVAAHYALAAEARCWLWLSPGTAIGIFKEALRCWPADQRRSGGVQRARLALAHADAGEPGRAAVEGLAALDVARSTGSDSIARNLTRLDRRLAAVDTPEVAEFREAFAARAAG